jgi:Zn-dependent peptidase ImmA (M78 family)
MQISDGAPAVADSIKTVLRVDLTAFRQKPSPEEAFALLRMRAESAGVFVLVIGNLGSHHTTINLETFRGFALADEIAPFVIINDHDSRAAWSFTLLHELAHLWLGQTGVSGAYSEEAIEKFCNDVASDLLLSEEELGQLDIAGATALEDSANLITGFARDRNLSSSMVAYKLYRTGMISQARWDQLSAVFRSRWLERRAEQRNTARSEEGGPNYYVVRRHRVGTALIVLVRRMMAVGALTTSKAGKVLGVKAKNVQTLVGYGDATDAGRLA